MGAKSSRAQTNTIFEKNKVRLHHHRRAGRCRPHSFDNLAICDSVLEGVNEPSRSGESIADVRTERDSGSNQPSTFTSDVQQHRLGDNNNLLSVTNGASGTDTVGLSDGLQFSDGIVPLRIQRGSTRNRGSQNRPVSEPVVGVLRITNRHLNCGSRIEEHWVSCLTRPRHLYNTNFLDRDSGECSICLEDLVKGNEIARLPCLCVYHKRCIDDWYKVKPLCPEHPFD
ncbi:E3 ubiquitin-protein ligase RNF6 [Erpetoichthys calabaricus]|uniref:RING-type E3 ubiquitin transferase n=1 Tax=Erpetoichthys calabaricus TaxID=27687 RepID=A0A8C4RH46_ERPCA|nr:E3 ubiquitin-protein ligase RNF6 [Erpetoichthys calabaricus]